MGIPCATIIGVLTIDLAFFVLATLPELSKTKNTFSFCPLGIFSKQTFSVSMIAVNTSLAVKFPIGNLFEELADLREDEVSHCIVIFGDVNENGFCFADEFDLGDDVDKGGNSSKLSIHGDFCKEM